MRTYLLLIFSLLSVTRALGQDANPQAVDTLYNATPLKEVAVNARWKNDTERYHYNQMKFYVTTILPYLNASVKLFTDVNAKTSDPNLSRKEKRKYINAREDEMRTQFEDEVRKLNVTQGKLLVKLIARQTNVNIYSILQEFKNPFTAIKWQAWARMNGMNLDRKYDPNDEPDLENIMYELGYPLPPSYAAN